MYRMPNGSVTRVHQEYAASWSKVYERIAEFFPGYRVSGFDPGVLLVDDCGDSMTLSIKACNALLSNEKIAKAECDRDSVEGRIVEVIDKALSNKVDIPDDFSAETRRIINAVRINTVMRERAVNDLFESEAKIDLKRVESYRNVYRIINFIGNWDPDYYANKEDNDLMTVDAVLILLIDRLKQGAWKGSPDTPPL